MIESKPLRPESVLRILITVFALLLVAELVGAGYAFTMKNWFEKEVVKKEIYGPEMVWIIGTTWTIQGGFLLLAVLVLRKRSLDRTTASLAWIIAMKPVISVVLITTVLFHLGIPDKADVSHGMVWRSSIMELVEKLFPVFLSVWMIRCLLAIRKRSRQAGEI